MGLILLFFDAKVDDKSEHFVSMEYLYVVTVFCFLQNCSCFVSRGFDFTLLCLYRISCFSFCFCFFLPSDSIFLTVRTNLFIYFFFFSKLSRRQFFVGSVSRDGTFVVVELRWCVDFLAFFFVLMLNLFLRVIITGSTFSLE